MNIIIVIKEQSIIHVEQSVFTDVYIDGNLDAHMYNEKV